MAKPAQNSPARDALLQAHQQRNAARSALAEAEDAHRLAVRDFHGAQMDVDEISADIRRVKARPCHGIGQLIEQVNAELSILYGKHDTATRAVAPFGIAATEAQTRLAAARTPVLNADRHVAQAAAAVVRAEAEPLARANLAQLHEAFATLLRAGPDLLAMLDLLQPDLGREIETLAGGMLRRATTWPEFEARRQHSPWRGAVAILEQDPQAALPSSVSVS